MPPSQPRTIGLQNARTLKQLSFLSPAAESFFLSDFLAWLLRELGGTLNNQAHGHRSPSALEHLTLCLRPESSFGELEVATYARGLSDVLANKHCYLNLKQVRFAVIPQCTNFEWMPEDFATEERYKEEMARAMRGLEEKGIVQLQWTQK
jgi:hypothetical protein